MDRRIPWLPGATYVPPKFVLEKVETEAVDRNTYESLASLHSFSSSMFYLASRFV